MKSSRRACGGYALVFVLIELALVSLATVVAVQRYVTDARREREEQLLWVGRQYRHALQAYHSFAAQGTGQQYPKRLEDLLVDSRRPTTARYLRSLYPDPVTGKADWVLDYEGDRIIGLHSSSTEAPLKRGNFAPGEEHFAKAKSYAEWRFLAGDNDNAGAFSAIPSLQGAEQSAADASASSAQTQAQAQPSTPMSASNINPGTDSTTTAQTSSGSNATDSDANESATHACYVQYGSPNPRCVGPNFPMGSSPQSCVQAFRDLLAQCLASAGS